MIKTKNGILISKAEALIISKLLKMASNELSNNSCNDLSRDFYKEVEPEELQQIARFFSEREGFEDVDSFEGCLYNDSIMLSLMASQLEDTLQ